MLLYITLFGIIYALLDAWHDLLFIRADQNWHSVDAAIKTFVAINIAILIGSDMHIEDNVSLWTIPVYILAIRWLVFDLFLNYLRFGFDNLLYTGVNNIQDRLFTGILAIMVKVILILVCLSILIIPVRVFWVELIDLLL